MSYESIIRNCAPTLAGIKVGSLYSYRFASLEELEQALQDRNAMLNPKGIFVVIFRVIGQQALIYIYRKSQLEALLTQSEIQEFLHAKGYKTFTIHACLSLLQCHLQQSDFPHEIGIFLGYPLADIKAFIANKGKHCKCSGCWKAYTNEDLARKTFQKFKKCTDVYCAKFHEGFDMKRLTVAC